MLDDNIKDLQSYCNRLASANLLVLDKEISMFLSHIAANEVLREIILDSNKNYSFAADWERFEKQQRIALSTNKRHIIAFTIGLLYKIDIKEISSIGLLSTFFSQSVDLQQAYFSFTRDVLLPMQEAFVSLIKGEPISQDDIRKETAVLDKMYEDVMEWLKIIEEKTLVLGGNLQPSEEKELLAMLKGFQDILERNDIYQSRLIWNGLKNTYYKYNIDCNELYEIEKLFKLYGIDLELK